MAPAGRSVWRAGRRSLIVVGAFAVLVGLGPLVAAVLTLVHGEAWPVTAVLAVVGLVSLGYAWRFGFHPRLDVGDELVVRNPFRTTTIAWSALTAARPGQDGLVLERSDGPPVEVWCVQTSRRETTGRGHALAHVFPADRYPYPTDEVRQRWERLLADEDVQVTVAERGGNPVGLVAYADDRVRHLAVLPEHAGSGIGTRLLTEACDYVFEDPFSTHARLWVLTANERARAFYAARGWTDGEARRTAEFPPNPEERELVRSNPRAARRGR